VGQKRQREVREPNQADFGLCGPLSQQASPLMHSSTINVIVGCAS